MQVAKRVLGIQSGEAEAVEVAAKELAAIEHQAGWARVEKVAAVVIRHLKTGKVGCGSTSKAPSIRLLAAHPCCPFSKTRLDEMLAAYEVLATDARIRSSYLLPSHVAVVARLAPPDRKALLEEAMLQPVSVRDLRRRVRALRRERGDRRGRPPTSPADKAVTRLENAEILLEEVLQLLAEAGTATSGKPRISALLGRLTRLVDKGFGAVGLEPAVPLVNCAELNSPQRIGMDRAS